MMRKFPTLILFALFIATAIRPLFSQLAVTPALSTPSQHTFDLTIRYHYSVADYLTPHSPEELFGNPETAERPERAMAELALAARDGKYDIWLSKWDVLSQQHLGEDMSGKGMTKDQYMAAYRQKLEGAEITKIASRGPYVFFILRGGPNGTLAIAFKSSGKGWFATTEVAWEAQQLAALAV